MKTNQLATIIAAAILCTSSYATPTNSEPTKEHNNKRYEIIRDNNISVKSVDDINFTEIRGKGTVKDGGQ